MPLTLGANVKINVTCEKLKPDCQLSDVLFAKLKIKVGDSVKPAEQKKSTRT